MLNIHANRCNAKFCDGFQRRQFLKIGALGVGGLSLPQILRAEAEQKIGSSNKSVIMVYLPGGTTSSRYV